MGVYLTQLRRWPAGRVPYVCEDVWALKRIEEFHRTLGKTIFFPRHSKKPDYVEISVGGVHHSSDIGMKGGKQSLFYERNSYYSLFHEMGHCLGLGHEYFHPNWPHRATLLGGNSLHKLAFQQTVGNYSHFGNFDPHSIMSYSPAAMGIQGAGAFLVPQKLSAGDCALIKHLYPEALAF